jgi:hypothetical protein
MLQTLPTACQSWSYVVAAAFLSEEVQKTILGMDFPMMDLALVQGRGQLGLDIKVEQLPVHPLPGSACLHARVSVLVKPGFASIFSDPEAVRWP